MNKSDLKLLKQAARYERAGGNLARENGQIRRLARAGYLESTDGLAYRLTENGLREVLHVNPTGWRP